MRLGTIGMPVLLAAVSVVVSGVAEHPDASVIVARSVQASDADFAAADRYDFTEKDVTPDGTMTSHVMMIRGTPYDLPVMKNGEPLTPEMEREAQRRLATTIAERRAESPRQTAERIAKYERSRKREQMMISQLTKAFDFKFVREEALAAHTVWVLDASPHSGYRPPNLETQALTGMAGTFWIDTATFQWAKVEAHVTRPVTIEGFLARVEPGTRFELDKQPVAPGIWLRSRFLMQSRARVLLLFKHRGQQDETYSDYHLAESSR